MKFISKIAAAIAVAIALAVSMGNPAKAQTYDAVNNIVLQGSIIDYQVSGALANAASTGTLATSTAVANATSVNLGNTSSLSGDINATGYVYGSMGGQVNGLVGQLSVMDMQNASAQANTSAVAATNSTSLAANIGNSATQRAGVTTMANQH